MEATMSARVEDIDHAAYPALRTVWIFVGVTFLFVPLRGYIRVKVLEGLKADDFYYFVSFICLLIYAIFVTLSAKHGLGRDLSAINSQDDVAKAILYEMIGQTFLIFGNVTSKLTTAFFLNHLIKQLVNSKKYKIVLWTPMALFAFFVGLALITTWLPCKPIARLWDPRINGHCSSSFLPIAYLAGALSVAVDFSYAIYPWWLLWRTYRHPQKLVILFSLSLGIAAGGIGVKRAIELRSLGSPNYLKDTVQLVIWHTAELSVTLIAIGIPICFPLYKHSLERLVSKSGWLSNFCGGRRTQNSDVEGGVYGMHTIGGSGYGE